MSRAKVAQSSSSSSHCASEMPGGPAGAQRHAVQPLVVQLKHGEDSVHYWNGDTLLLFGIENQALVSFRCSPETSCYTSSSNNSTSKLCLVPRRGWAQRMEMLPTLRENSPSSKHLQEQSATIWWTNIC
jgi:hypothetical protein